ncbi:hypothetical protein PM082_015737 [Marasmius tenuissimus]|nr:hypothetical protein PM082_015737 [Marasmius tenuissimus]
MSSSPRLELPSIPDGSFVPAHPISEASGVSPFDASVELPVVDSLANTLVADRRREPQSYPRVQFDDAGTLGPESSQELRTPFDYYSEHVLQVCSQAYYTPPVSYQPTLPIASTNYLHQYASGSNTPFGFDSYDSPTLPRSLASEAAGPQSVIAPHSPVIIQSTTLEVRNVPLSDANVERPIVGSMANTLVARSLRRREPKYFCDVPGCTAQGFTQKHNLEYHKRSHRNERPYHCDLCFRPFGARSNLNRHINRGTCRPP